MTEDPVAPLIAKVAAQDRAAFRDLYSVTASKLLGVLLRILGTRSEAEDALQEVFTRVWLRAARFDPEKGRGMTWLIAIARNHAIDRLRSKSPAQAGAEGNELDSVPDSRATAEGTLIAKGEARRIADCFATLEQDKAQAVRGAYLDGLSYIDLAERFAVPINTMRTWLRRSLLKLRECMDQ